MELTEALIYTILAILMFKIQSHAYTKLERAVWIIAGIGWTLAAIIKLIVVATRI